ncbi:LLM class flavin-dependent oxidoreductase [Serratia fonticola]|uniref:LLM class flavin-dependent oxidoreductase n=1 Tax=Serratia fonticola TaxID=47917 RepID=UPI001AE5880A|nr:LLM class flavin-dependent oxidoreductase [Serratia fonticola]MBP0997620.1 LLM class flavin-dependent oxidoreductase [Serratia fonticola]MBP1001708.1 LLM class flavin-dependent oxidoreductase [Serratia fonticola]MBP1011777.1 LLM class flavin-dependent oxidoreductase [Serratia fonticola]MBP1016365.1 LLM class flavin-dependent oxidoreductase [Serratia fonticola]CAI0899193.1 Nitrilotriacetate monooxygenase component A [Serratia fonticola]
MIEHHTMMKLGAFWYPTGYHIAAWRHASVQANAGINFQHCAEFARMAESAAFDFIFLADSLAVKGDDWAELSRGAHRYVGQFEPLTLLSALSACTERIGLIASATTTYHHPYNLARQFASLAHLSQGRAGWNMVTSQNPFEADNFGLDSHPEHDRRYLRAEEFVDVVAGLWRSWDHDAFCFDKQSGVFFDVAKMRPLNHQGDFFQVKGPLNVPACPGGAPVIVQAGASEAGRSLAARTSEVIFSAQHELQTARMFYQDVKQRAQQAGRAQLPLVMTGMFPFVGRSQQEAQDKFEQLQALIDDRVGLALLQVQLGGIDLSGHDLDGPLPVIPPSNASQSRRELLVSLAARENYSIRQLYRHVAGARGHWQLIGTPRQIVDEMEEWFSTGASDGFNVMAPWLPGGMSDFINLVVPELRRRGLFRQHYTGRTLRDHLGLSG